MLARCSIALLLVALAAPTGAQDEIEERTSRGELYEGAAFLYSLDHVTVVYPARGDERLNRRSAERRAAYLEQAHGVRAEISSDEDLTAEQRTGHLLLLGWDNAVLGGEGPSRLFTGGPEGVDFLGARVEEPGLDLLYYARSPFNPERLLTFWSRIDPERDRFQVLPRLGSDWAIYRDYRILWQGMFRPGRAWPPVRDVEAERDHRGELTDLLDRWQQRRTEHYRIFYDPAHIDSGLLDRIAAAREEAHERAAAIVADGSDSPITLWVYGDAAQKQHLTGVPDPAHSLPSRREMHLIADWARSPSPHEEIHILAHHRLGGSTLTTVYEGLALAATGSLGGAPLGLTAAHMLDRNAFPSLEPLLDEEQARRLPDQERFAAAGLLMRWVSEAFDGERLAAVYGMERGSVAELASALGRDARRVEQEFSEWVAGEVDGHRNDARAIELERLAQRELLAGDFEGVVAALEQVVELRPGEPQALFNLASAQMRVGRYGDAERVLTRMLELPLGPDDSRFEIFGHFQLGRVLDLQGRREVALASYRRVLELPDQHDAHRLAREAIEQPFSADQLE